MAITFLEQKKKQKYLIFSLVIIVLIIFLVLWYGFFVKNKTPSPSEAILLPEPIEIEWGLFGNPIFQELQPYPEIIPFESHTTEGEEIGLGRENPFMPY